MKIYYNLIDLRNNNNPCWHMKMLLRPWSRFRVISIFTTLYSCLNQYPIFYSENCKKKSQMQDSDTKCRTRNMIRTEINSSVTLSLILQKGIFKKQQNKMRRCVPIFEENKNKVTQCGVVQWISTKRHNKSMFADILNEATICHYSLVLTNLQCIKMYAY